MSQSKTPLPLTHAQAIELYFMEHRAKLIDIAAFLDRLDRAENGSNDQADFRIQAFHRALALLSDGRDDRARRVLELFSDSTTEPIAKASMKGATGASLPAGQRT